MNDLVMDLLDADAEEVIQKGDSASGLYMRAVKEIESLHKELSELNRHVGKKKPYGYVLYDALCNEAGHFRHYREELEPYVTGDGRTHLTIVELYKNPIVVREDCNNGEI